MYKDIDSLTTYLALNSGLSGVKSDVETHTNNNDIHVTASDKSNWNNKANASDVYTKTETDNKITTKVAEIVAGAPEDFDTLKEMSDWIASHEHSAAEMNSEIQTLKTDILFKTLPENHNAIFRGDDLFAKGYTIDDICAMISDGSFSDIYIGDYFTLSGTIENVPCFVEQTDDEGTTTLVESTQTVTYNTKFRIAGLDTYLNTGDTALTAHHAVIVSDGIIGTNRMNSTNITTGGYVGSFMHTSVIPIYDTHFSEKLNNHLLEHRDLLSTSTSNWGWYSIKTRLMSEVEVFGTRVFGSNYDIGTAYRKFPLFELAPKYICNRNTYWLRAVSSSAVFAYVSHSGNASNNSASGVDGVRPRFVIG